VGHRDLDINVYVTFLSVLRTNVCPGGKVDGGKATVPAALCLLHQRVSPEPGPCEFCPALLSNQASASEALPPTWRPTQSLPLGIHRFHKA
jgi:hypothetical protein